MLIRSRAPLRLGLAGGGTDVSPFCDLHGGAVLNATIDLYAKATLEPSKDGTVEFRAADWEIVRRFPAAASYSLESDLPLHAAVYNRMVRDFNDGKPLPTRLTTYCDVPPGSGLGGSSTMVVAIVQAYVEYLGLPLGEYDVAHLAFEIERSDVGLHGGKQDQYAAAFGGFNFMEFGSGSEVLVNPLRIKNWIVSELESSLILFYTGKSRASAEIIAEQSRSVEESKEDPISAMLETKRQAFRMKEALLRGNMEQLADVMKSAWQAKKRMASAISNERIEHVYETARDKGAISGKISGAGGGGFMIFLADPTRRLDVVRALRAIDGGCVIESHFSKEGAEAWRIE
jgi:D-glycero-alpha-D-manno-heptose-7-phosphate kinase